MFKKIHTRLLMFALLVVMQPIAYGAAAPVISVKVTKSARDYDPILGPASIEYRKGSLADGLIICTRFSDYGTQCRKMAFTKKELKDEWNVAASENLPANYFDKLEREYEEQQKQEKQEKDKKDQLEKKKAADDTSAIVLPRIWKQKNLAFNQAWEQAQTNADKVYLLEEAIKIVNTRKALQGLEYYIDNTSILPYLKIDLKAKIQDAKQRIQ